MYSIGNNLNYISRGLVASRPLIVNLTPFLNISNSMKCTIIYDMIFSIAHWNAWDDKLEF